MESHSFVQSMRSVLPFLSFALSLFVAASAYGDGIPVAPDHKSVTVESFTIPLNKDQVTQVERLRKVTLTKEQSAPLLAVYDKCPQTIEVVSSRYSDCTCGMGAYAIWCRPGEVEIPRDSIYDQKDLDAYDAENPPEAQDAEEKPDTVRYESEEFILDSAGKTYLDGKEIKETEILAMIDTMHERQKQNKRLECYLNLDVPPPIDEATDTRVRELADRIGTHCEKRGVNFWAQFFSAEKYR